MKNIREPHLLEENRSKPYKFNIGIKSKMFCIIVVFIICVMVCIWVFQVGMLNFFFQNTKYYELEDSADTIIEAMADESEAKYKAEILSEKYTIDIWLLRINGEKGEWVIKENGSDTELLKFLPQKFEALYSRAVDNGGKYIATVPIEQLTDSAFIEVLDDNLGKKDSFPNIARYDEPVGTLYVRVEKVGTQSYMLVQHANLTPLQSTISMLRSQFVFIGVAMILMSVILVAIISKMITKPFIKMNDAAKKLAQGCYDADFSGRGYREIDELAESLNFASRELAKTDTLQKELISNISHDLRTPLTMIKGYSEVIRDIPGENTPENVQVIIDETTRLSELVNDMLDLSKIQSGTRKPDYERFSITQTVRETLTRYEKLIMQNGLKIDFYAEQDAFIYADRGMILQVIYNLINNAINYTGADKYVTVRQTLTDTSVRISVSDTGGGIAPEDISQIWERYYRVDKVHKRATVGTGLGLSIVKEILETHGASYGVESAVGMGSTFWFEMLLPDITNIIDAQYDNTEDGEI